MIPKVNEIIENYEFLQLIGSGSFADVLLAEYQLIDEKVGIKIINKKKKKSETIDQENSNDNKFTNVNKDEELQINQKFLQEINMMELVKYHPFIIQLFNLIETSNYYNIIMEYGKNGNLAEQMKMYKDRLKSKSKLKHENTNDDIINFGDENEIKKIFVQIVRTVIYLHDQCHIAHRDLKAENILIDENMNIKIIDFGFGCKIIDNTKNSKNLETSTLPNENSNKDHIKSNINDDDSGHLKTHTRPILEDQSICGPPNYVPPEMILKNIAIGEEVDTWMLGILLYFIIYNNFPYNSHDVTNLISKIAYLDYHIPETRIIIKKVVQSRKLKKKSHQFSSDNNHQEEELYEEDDDDMPNFMKFDMFSNLAKERRKQKHQVSQFMDNSNTFGNDNKNDEEDTKTVNVIKYKEVKVPVSSSCRDLIRKMLCKDPLKRISLKDILKHLWIMEAKDFMNGEDTRASNISKLKIEQDLEEELLQKSRLAAKLATRFAEISDSELMSVNNISLKDIVESFYQNKEVPFDLTEVEEQMKENVYNDNTAILRILFRREEQKQMKKLINSFINDK